MTNKLVGLLFVWLALSLEVHTCAATIASHTRTSWSASLTPSRDETLLETQSKALSLKEKQKAKEPVTIVVAIAITAAVVLLATRLTAYFKERKLQQQLELAIEARRAEATTDMCSVLVTAAEKFSETRQIYMELYAHDDESPIDMGAFCAETDLVISQLSTLCSGTNATEFHHVKCPPTAAKLVPSHSKDEVQLSHINLPGQPLSDEDDDHASVFSEPSGTKVLPPLLQAVQKARLPDDSPSTQKAAAPGAAKLTVLSLAPPTVGALAVKLAVPLIPSATAVAAASIAIPAFGIAMSLIFTAHTLYKMAQTVKEYRAKFEHFYAVDQQLMALQIGRPLCQILWYTLQDIAQVTKNLRTYANDLAEHPGDHADVSDKLEQLQQALRGAEGNLDEVSKVLAGSPCGGLLGWDDALVDSDAHQLADVVLDQVLPVRTYTPIYDIRVMPKTDGCDDNYEQVMSKTGVEIDSVFPGVKTGEVIVCLTRQPTGDGSVLTDIQLADTAPEQDALKKAGYQSLTKLNKKTLTSTKKLFIKREPLHSAPPVRDVYIVKDLDTLKTKPDDVLKPGSVVSVSETGHVQVVSKNARYSDTAYLVHELDLHFYQDEMLADGFPLPKAEE